MCTCVGGYLINSGGGVIASELEISESQLIIPSWEGEVEFSLSMCDAVSWLAMKQRLGYISTPSRTPSLTTYAEH